MAFDPEVHQAKQILIRCGRALRECKGLPPENNITILYEEASIALGIPLLETTTADAGRIPPVHEMKTIDGTKFLVPRKDCPSCGGKETMILGPLCGSCVDAKDEDGKRKYHTMWQCTECKVKDRSEKFFAQWMTELGVEMPTGTKEQLGIRTFTDTGLK